MPETNQSVQSTKQTPDQIVSTCVKGALGLICVVVASFFGINAIRRSNARTKAVQNAGNTYKETLDTMLQEYKNQNNNN